MSLPKYTDLQSARRNRLVEVLPLPKPFTVHVEASGMCNFRCRQCFQSLPDVNEMTKYKRHLDYDLFKRMVDELAQWGPEKVRALKMHLGGESLLNPRFTDMVRYAKEKGVADRIEFSTNASVLTERMAEELVACGLDYFRVSIYSVIPERHRQVTGSPIDVERIFANVATLRRIRERAGSAKPEIIVKMFDSFDDENAAFQAKYAPVADEVTSDNIYNYVFANEEENYRALYGEKAALAQERATRRVHPKEVCPYPFYMVAIRSNGDVMSCGVDWWGYTKIGSLLTQSLREIWEGESLFELRKLLLERRKSENRACKDCNIYQYEYYSPDNIDDFPLEKLRQGRAK